MSYLKGSFTYHKPSYEPEGHPHRTCLYCGEPWPCDPAVILADVLEDERERVARFLRDFPQATRMAGHRVFDLDTVALMILRAEHLRCPDCGGEGGGGTMDPDVWIECTTCSGKGRV